MFFTNALNCSANSTMPLSMTSSYGLTTAQPRRKTAIATVRAAFMELLHSRQTAWDSSAAGKTRRGLFTSYFPHERRRKLLHRPHPALHHRHAEFGAQDLEHLRDARL